MTLVRSTLAADPGTPSSASRRRILVACGAAALSGCAGGWARQESERIVDLESGRDISRDTLLARLRDSDVALLGELHDNPRHHARRGELIAALGAEVTVLAEHLPRGQEVRFGTDLRASLVAAGFEPEAWGWPLHEPLFGAIARSGARLLGANASNELVRRIAREGRAALPTGLARLIDAAPLAAAAQEALDADLVDGHCGHLGGVRLEAMRWAQRARDATMALALRDALVAQDAAGRRGPVVLVAGNGHVRRDYGAAQLLRRLAPDSRGVEVAFLESASGLADAPYAAAWITLPAARDDPCEGMELRMRSAAPPKAPASAASAR